MQIASIAYNRGADVYDEAEQNSPYWTLVLVTYGKCVYWVGTAKLILEKGELLLIPAHTAYYTKGVPTMLHEKYAVKFALNGEALQLPIVQYKTYGKVWSGKWELLADRMKSMHRHWQERAPYYVVLCEALLTELLVYINREVEESPAAPAAHRLADLMKAHIQNHYRERVTKEELAEVIQRSPNHAAKIFRDITGQTIGEYVHAARMKTAVYMLQYSVLTVAEISEFVGYGDPSYFYRVFRRMTGHVPAHFLAAREEVRK